MNKLLSLLFVSSSFIVPYKDVKQVFWFDSSNVLVVSDLTVYRYDIETKQEVVMKYIERNTVVGLDGEEIVECKFKQFVKRNMDDVATTVFFKDKEFDFKDSVIPVYCNSNYIYLKNAFDFLEDYFYKINIKENKIEDIEEKEIKEVIDSIQTLDNRKVYISENGYVEVRENSQSPSLFLEHFFSNCIDLILSKLSDLNLLHIVYQR